tara:strand:+ start:10910 stop:11470 length:561 start_codon:yes stop_codon:yes gene_type:complete
VAKQKKYNSIEAYLRSYGKYIVRQARQILQKRTASGKLSKSLKYKLVKDKDGYDLKFLSAKYGDFIQKGVSGRNVTRSYIGIDGKRKQSPYRFKSKTINTKVLDKWIIRKGLVPRDSSGKFQKRSVNAVGFRKSLAFLIGRKIASRGLKAMSFYSQPISFSFNKFKKEMLANFKEDVLNNIKAFKK